MIWKLYYRAFGTWVRASTFFTRFSFISMYNILTLTKKYQAYQDVKSDDFVLHVHWDCTFPHINLWKYNIQPHNKKIYGGIQNCMKLFHVYFCTTGEDSLINFNHNTGIVQPFHLHLSSQARGKWLSSLNSKHKKAQTPLPILKFEKEAASRASTAADSFLSNPKNEQFWNASRLLAMRRFKPLRLSLRIISSLWYLEDGVSKSSGPKESGCIWRPLNQVNYP